MFDMRSKGNPIPLLQKLWIYTNYDCNLNCSYCVAESTPRAAQRRLNLAMVQRLCDEAAALGFERVYFTGGEPFILPEIYPNVVLFQLSLRDHRAH